MTISSISLSTGSSLTELSYVAKKSSYPTESDRTSILHKRKSKSKSRICITQKSKMPVIKCSKKNSAQTLLAM